MTDKFDIVMKDNVDFEKELDYFKNMVKENRYFEDENVLVKDTYVFRDDKNIVFLNKNRMMSLSVKKDYFEEDKYDITFINKIRILPAINDNYRVILYVNYPFNKDLANRFKSNPIQFIRILNGNSITGMSGKCADITEHVKKFLK